MKEEERLKTAAFVPVKLNNERAPGKNTKRFDDGTPLITHFLKTLRSVPEIDELYVFCSQPEIREYLIDGVTFLRRPAFLDTKEATPQDIISEFLKLVDADVYAVCHCTSPFVTKEHVSECMNAVLSGAHDSSFTGEKIQRLMWTADNEPLNFKADHVPRTQDLPPLYNEVSAAYVFKRSVFEQFRRRIGITPHITEVKGIECVDIDYPEDFEIANAIYMRLIKGEK